MQTKTKVAIGVGAAVVGGILCYFYCPCFKKNKGVTGEVEGVVTPDYMGASPTDLGSGMPVRQKPGFSFATKKTNLYVPVVIE